MYVELQTCGELYSLDVSGPPEPLSAAHYASTNMAILYFAEKLFTTHHSFKAGHEKSRSVCDVGTETVCSIIRYLMSWLPLFSAFLVSLYSLAASHEKSW